MKKENEITSEDIKRSLDNYVNPPSEPLFDKRKEKIIETVERSDIAIEGCLLFLINRGIDVYGAHKKHKSLMNLTQQKEKHNSENIDFNGRIDKINQ